MSARSASAPRTARPLGRPRDGVSAATRERLLEVARQCFARDGYAATTNKAIAEAAGLTAGAIYHYYESKADLYAAVYGEVQRLIRRAFEEATAPVESFIDRVSAALEVSIVLNRRDPSITGFVVNVPYETQRHPELAAHLQPYREARFSMSGWLVDEAVARRELADDIEPLAVRDLLNAIFSGLARFHNHAGDTERHAGAVHVMQRFLRATAVVPPA